MTYSNPASIRFLSLSTFLATARDIDLICLEVIEFNWFGNAAKVVNEKMSEKQFRKRLLKELKNELSTYIVNEGENLLYKLIIDTQGNLQPSNFANPKRGQLAFQTDLLIRNDKVPLVVIETKFGGFSTHDVLTYSTKAMKHKEVYPYVRYGLVVGGRSKIDRKFFTHNAGFDFAVAMGNTEDDLKELVEIVKKQIQNAELMLDVLKKKEVRKYVTNIELR